MSDQPRQDQEAERAVVGAVLMGGAPALDKARGVGLRAEHFYVPMHEMLWGVMEGLAAAGRPIDRASIVATLTADQKRMVGTPHIFADLLTEASMKPMVEVHAEIVVDSFSLRRLAEAGIRIGQLAQAAPLDRSREALERARAALDAVEVPEENKTIASAGEMLPGLIDEIEDGKPRGISTGIGDLDRLLGGGLGRGQSIVVGARPSVGKTMLGCHLARTAAKQGVPTIFFSHEMTRSELMQRLLSAETGVHLTRIRGGMLEEDDWERIARAQAQIMDWPLLIDDQSSATVADYRSRLRALARGRRPRLLVSDYLQLVKPDDPRIPRQEQVSGISASIKALAKDFELPAVVLAQLSRATEQRRNSRPILSDLRESGAIENDADIVMLMHQREAGKMDVEVAKHRQGERGMTELYWHPRNMRCGGLYDGERP